MDTETELELAARHVLFQVTDSEAQDEQRDQANHDRRDGDGKQVTRVAERRCELRSSGRCVPHNIFSRFLDE